MIANVKTLPRRDKVKPADTWDLTSLFPSDDAWEKAFKKWEGQIGRFDDFRGQLAKDAKTLAACLKFDNQFDRAGERLGSYAFLKTTEDMANSVYQRMIGRYRNVASRAGQAASYIRPEIMGIPAATMKKFLAAKELAEFRLLLEQLLRYKPHTLSKHEEKLLAMQAEMSDAANQAFRQLTDADLKWGSVKNEEGQLVELSNATFSAFLQSPDRRVRKKAFHEYYRQFAAHENTLAATLNGSIQRDVYYARARNHPSALAASLFHDNVPESVVRQPDRLGPPPSAGLVSLLRSAAPQDAVARHPPLRHLRADLERAEEPPHLGPGRAAGAGGDRAVGQANIAAHSKRGLNGRWCDRYPNQGKQSGAFSCGSFDGDPYILMNYQPDVLDHVFTLAPRGRPLDAQLLLGAAPAVSVLQLRDLRGRGGQHVQRAAARPAPDGAAPRATANGRF